MNEGPFFLDVNVPMYAAGKEHPYKDACVWVMTEIANGRLDAAIDAEIIQEMLYRFGAMQQWQIGGEIAQSLLDLIPVVLPVTVEDTETAVSLFAQYAPQGVKARDVLHTAVMHNHQLTHIISTDKHFDHIDEVTRLDPKVLFTEK